MNPWWVEQYVFSFALTLAIKKIILLQLKDIFTLYKQLYMHSPSAPTICKSVNNFLIN